MAGAGVTQSVCLPLLSVYQLSTNGAIQVGAASFIHSSWECTWRASLALTDCGWRLPERCGGKKVTYFCMWFVQTSASSRKSLDAPSWPGVYRLSMSLMERLLKTLRYNFLTEALDFVGVHQERILQVCYKLPLGFTGLLCLAAVGMSQKGQKHWKSPLPWGGLQWK